MTRPAPLRPPPRARRTTLLAGGVAGALAAACALAGDAGAARATGDPEAVRLLRAAADAARRVSYEGVRYLTTWGTAGTRTAQVRVSHTAGAGTAFTAVRPPSAGGYQPDSAAARDAGLNAATIALLARNYRLVRVAGGTVCGRAAQVIEARRADGSAAGRFWIDAATGLLLHRELIDATGRQVAVSGFTQVRMPAPRPGFSVTVRGGPPERGFAAGEPEPVRADVPASTATTRPWPDLLDARELDALRRAGWSLPDTLLGSLSLREARRAAGDGTVHLSYTDGLATVSVFVQRGALDRRRLRGWTRSTSGGRTVYRRDDLRRWAVAERGGYVYTVLTEAPQSTAVAAAKALPPDRSAVRGRIGRGLRRLGGWVNPFD
ncbi:sigma-E factor regulatory protein RseB domain-containing protein [Actinomadura hibisca]|uniref:sigma-E factor regulatory protein RseB domain-containing protein n=1 Tax=Actinomadura hibisca TaxID=68565 RepID=UPI00083073B6|nr:sigma-E factor regulatory protein RseB domain-containing protein [Actinomadura hibisca]